MNNTVGISLNNNSISTTRGRRDQKKLNTSSIICYKRKLANTNDKFMRNQPHFGRSVGVDPMNIVIKPMQAIERRGKTAEFIVLDLTSTMLPRIVQSYNRNSEELGHPNYAAGKEEIICQFTTGPSMFVLPMAILAIGRKIGGNSTDIRFEYLARFKESFSQTISKDEIDKTKLRENFFKQSFNDILESTKNASKSSDDFGKFVCTKVDSKTQEKSKEYGQEKIKSLEKHVEKLTSQAEEIAENNIKLAKMKGKDLTFKEKIILNLPKFIVDKFNIAKSMNINDYEKLLTRNSELQSKITKRIVKLNKYAGNFNTPESVNISLDKNKPKMTNIKSLFSDMLTYAEDVVKKVEQTHSTNLKEVFEKTHKSRKTGRIMLIASAVLSTGVFLYFTPKMYQRSKSNPGLEGLSNGNKENPTSKKKKEEVK